MGTRWRAHPVHALEHSDAEIEAAHVHRICAFPFHGCHLCVGLGISRGTGCGGRRAVNRCFVVIVNELVLPCVLDGRKDRGSGQTDDDFIVIICIAQLMHNFDDDAYKISLARRQGA